MPVRLCQCRSHLAGIQRGIVGQREWRELAHVKKKVIFLSRYSCHVKKSGISFHDESDMSMFFDFCAMFFVYVVCEDMF